MSGNYRHVMASYKKPVAGGWWLAGGIGPANCVAAYQAKSAASYAASKVNLANAGTYDAVDVIGETTAWDATNGWKRISNDGGLDTGILPTSSGWSLIIRFSNVTSGTNGYSYIIGKTETGKTMAIGSVESNQHAYYNSGKLRLGENINIGVMAIAGQTGYLNGSSEGTIPTSWSGVSTKSLYLMICNGLGDANLPPTIYVQAAAVYNATLTADQVSALTTAMNAL